MTVDAHKNFAYGTVLTAPSPAASGTSLVLNSGQGALMPAVPFNVTIWPTAVQPTAANAEIARVTAISTDTLTITRTQEGFGPRTVIVGDQVSATITKKTLIDAEGMKIEQDAWSGTASPVCRENMDREAVTQNTIVLGATGIMTSYGIPLYEGDVITKLAFRSGAQGAVTPTHWWFALYDTQATPALLQQTADQTTTAWAAATVKDVALASPVTIAKTGLYYAAIMMTAGTLINVVGALMTTASLATGIVSGQGAKAQSSGSGLTTTAPGTIATPTGLVGVGYVVGH